MAGGTRARRRSQIDAISMTRTKALVKNVSRSPDFSGGGPVGIGCSRRFRAVSIRMFCAALGKPCDLMVGVNPAAKQKAPHVSLTS